VVVGSGGGVVKLFAGINGFGFEGINWEGDVSSFHW